MMTFGYENRSNMTVHLSRRLAIAPMLAWTDRHFRYWMRLLTKRTLLYTEMVTSHAILYGSSRRLLGYHPSEHPLALQVAGNDPYTLALCARIAADWGYDEVNLNVGCPSNRVQKGRFGACLMLEPDLVAECVAAMKAVVSIPVTVKTRLGIGRNNHHDILYKLIAALLQAGCDTVILHARNAWLDGINPSANRLRPPLDYDRGYQLKQQFPAVKVVINGGITSLTQAEFHLQRFDGVMIGQAAYRNPWLFANADAAVFHDSNPCADPWQAIDAFIPYVERQQTAGIPLATVARHLYGLFQGYPGAQTWRRLLNDYFRSPHAPATRLRDAAAAVQSCPTGLG
jgi:tRNA-dihydrouridine synthase A